MKDKRIFPVEGDRVGQRLDIFVAAQLEQLSRSQVQKLIATGQVLVNGEARKAGYRVSAGEEVVVLLAEEQAPLLQAEDIPLDIVYQDNDVVVLNKPKGLVVHPAHGNWEHTLVNALLFHVKTLSTLNGELRPGIVHRLDKDTSGLMVVAKHDEAHRILAEQVKAYTLRREYLALVHGVVKGEQGSIKAPIGRSLRDRKKMAVVDGGRLALSHYEVLARFRDYSLLKVGLFTGRTHQIRVHMQYIKHPVVGDSLYTARKAPCRVKSQLLHACLLGFKHPQKGTYMEFSAALPAEFEGVLDYLRRV